MKLGCLLAGMLELSAEWSNIRITGLSCSSLEVEKGFAFIALTGATNDGRRYANYAADRGAVVVLSSSEAPASFRGCAWITVARLEACLQTLAHRFYGFPDRNMRLFAITGTNGKTSSAWLFASALNIHGAPCGYIGSLGVAMPPERVHQTRLTTPDLIALYRYLHFLQRQGAKTVVLEASSHALNQNRLGALQIECAWFTNITEDHIEYHGSWEAYKQAKKKLFSRSELQCMLLNKDDGFSDELSQVSDSAVVRHYGRGGNVALSWSRCSERGLNLVMSTCVGNLSTTSRLIGYYNAKNLEGVVLALLYWGLGIEEVSALIHQLVPVPGRAELIHGEDRNIVIDYAHTADALRQILRSMQPITKGKIWCVFGCGGERDHNKRSDMGRIASNFAHVVILTDDNPRSESPEGIVRDIVAGMSKRPFVIHDRANAISYALRRSEPGDTIVIAGKGDEHYQIYQDQRHAFHDRSFVEQYLQQQRAETHSDQIRA